MNTIIFLIIFVVFVFIVLVAIGWAAQLYKKDMKKKRGHNPFKNPFDD
jgi:hypothetical protein